MADKVIHQENFKHSYPYDWRTKLPVIIRASKQWFVKTGEIKDRALVSQWLCPSHDVWLGRMH